MIIHRSNRTEVLVDEFAAVVARGPRSPFEPETIVVQGQGMERWLSMQLADRLGVFANPDVLSLRKLLDRLSQRVLGEEINPAFDAESLMWSIAELLPQLENTKSFESIRRYLEGDAGGRRRIQLAYQIAKTFYRYMTYRPKMVIDWPEVAAAEIEDADARWQAALWRALTRRHGTDHLAGRAYQLIAQLGRGDVDSASLPSRVSVFGVSSLPTLYLDLFTSLSRQVEIHLFLLSPSKEYWADIVTPQETRRELQQDRNQDEASLHLDVGHPLLASLGSLGRDLLKMLEGEGGYEESANDLYRDPEGSGMLQRLQRDILHLRDPNEAGTQREAFDPEDRSVRIHSCHGPMREVEVLCEELISRFEADPSLEPQDVVVMTPDIKTYAPYVEAVFGIRSRGRAATLRGEGSIPYRIADRWPDPADEVVDAFRRGLDFARGRFSAADAVDLLGLPCVARRFGFERPDLEAVRAWIMESGIRWGVDAAHRAEFDQPETNDNTWRFGLDRLLLGYAIDAIDDAHPSLYRGVRPLGGVEGQNAETLGQLLDFCSFLFAQAKVLSQPRTPEAWSGLLLDFLSGFVIDDNDNHEQHLMLRDAVEKVARHAAAARFHEPVSLESFREQVDRQLEHARRSTGFLSGGVTFCELVPMRSIPFRVVCLLGMNDDAFPRIQHAPGFDLVTRYPRLGDRTSRIDDRYLFLEALLSARERLVVTYLGQSLKDGSPIPASAVVNELIEVLSDSLEIEGASRRERRTRIREAIETRHPLQPFSPRYFDASSELRFEVHSEVYREAAVRMLGPRDPQARFVGAPLHPRAADDSMLEVDLDDLVAFFRAPAMSFLRDRLGIRLREDHDDLAIREPYGLDSLDRFQIAEPLLEWVAAGATPEQCRSLVRASGRLPHDVAGEIEFADLMRDVQTMARHTAKLRDAKPEPPFAFDVELAGARLSGTLSDLGERGQVLSRFSKLGGRSELDAWIRHLAMQLVCEREGTRFPAIERATFVVGRPKTDAGAWIAWFPAVAKAEALLSDLVDLFRSASVAPLPLFRDSSRIFAEHVFKGDDRAKALGEARKRFDVGGFNAGESEQPDIALAFKGIDPLDPDCKHPGGHAFEDVAVRVFGPLLAARREDA